MNSFEILKFKMLCVKIFSLNSANKNTDEEFDFGDESLADLITKYDKSLDCTNSNVLIGD